MLALEISLATAQQTPTRFDQQRPNAQRTGEPRQSDQRPQYQHGNHQRDWCRAATISTIAITTSGLRRTDMSGVRCTAVSSLPPFPQA